MKLNNLAVAFHSRKLSNKIKSERLVSWFSGDTWLSCKWITSVFPTRPMNSCGFDWWYAISIGYARILFTFFIWENILYKYSIIIWVSQNMDFELFQIILIQSIIYVLKSLVNSGLTLKMTLKWHWNDRETTLKWWSFCDPSIFCAIRSDLWWPFKSSINSSMISSNAQLPVSLWH